MIIDGWKPMMMFLKVLVVFVQKEDNEYYLWTFSRKWLIWVPNQIRSPTPHLSILLVKKRGGFGIQNL
jgi:hypothetical protein